MAHSDVLLLTSEVEGTPNVLLEAQYLQCPVVTTRAGGAQDALLEGETGLSCEVDDDRGLADAVDRLLRDPDLRTRMGLRGRAFVADKYEVEARVDDTLTLYGLDALSTPPRT
jgi:glycosyltransferase involved in cell wall biosynthesis